MNWNSQDAFGVAAGATVKVKTSERIVRATDQPPKSPSASRGLRSEPFDAAKADVYGADHKRGPVVIVSTAIAREEQH